jgi:hypothetical protein
MALLLRTPDKKLQLTKEELQYLVAYLDKSKSVGFVGVNFYKHQRDREELYKFSLLTLCEKLMTKLFNNAHSIQEKKISFPINFAEEKTLIVMFNRVDCGSYLLALQAKILLTLRPLKVLTEI